MKIIKKIETEVKEVDYFGLKIIVPTSFEWIAVNEDGTLCGFQSKPELVRPINNTREVFPMVWWPNQYEDLDHYEPLYEVDLCGFDFSKSLICIKHIQDATEHSDMDSTNTGRS